MAFERTSKTGVAANFANGGEARPSTLPSSARNEIERLINLSEVSYGAIDLLIKKDQVSILELNVVPGIEQAEAVSGLSLIPKILSLFKGSALSF